MAPLQSTLSPENSLSARVPPMVWALDAFSKDFVRHARTAEAMQAHMPEGAIHPVYVLSETVFLNRGYSSFLRAALKPRAHKNLVAVLDHELLSSLRRTGCLRPPRVLVESSADASLCTQRLLRYAKHIGARLVGIGASGRSPLSRWFTGSFAETLISGSRLPLLITGPKQGASLKIPTVFVLPTDFNPSRRIEFTELLEIAAKKKISLHLVHDETETAKAEAQHWMTAACERGVELRFVSAAVRTSAAKFIVAYARQIENKNSPFIAIFGNRGLASNDGWLPARLTRDLIRSSPYPLYLWSTV